jgi:hypothetical protein
VIAKSFFQVWLIFENSFPITAPFPIVRLEQINNLHPVFVNLPNCLTVYLQAEIKSQARSCDMTARPFALVTFGPGLVLPFW